MIEVYNWKQFGKRIRNSDTELLKDLHKYPDSILVTGCQRSGTTMLSRIIRNSEGIKSFNYQRDDELEGALILCGIKNLNENGRMCFQTTYLNECYTEYFDSKNMGNKIIWMLRNPYSVVYSFLYNWKRFALNELFKSCGSELLTDADKCRYEKFGPLGISRAKRACLSYNGKIMQIYKMKNILDPKNFIIIEYEELVNHPDAVLRGIYNFIGVEYKSSYAKIVNTGSLNKAKKLPKRIINMVKQTCEYEYFKVKKSLI